MKKYVVNEFDAYGENDDTFYSAPNITSVYRHIFKNYSNIDLTCFFEDIIAQISYDIEHRKSLMDDVYFINFMDKDDLINYAETKHSLTIDSILSSVYGKNGPKIKKEIKNCPDFDMAAVYLNAIVIEQLYLVDKVAVIDSLSSSDLKALLNHLYTPGEGIQEGNPGKEWYGITISKYIEPEFISLN